jgi:hypothetical protein
VIIGSIRELLAVSFCDVKQRKKTMKVPLLKGLD